MKWDYLIIGQGLAGSIMAYQLLKRGKHIAIIDEGKSFTSSTVAAGLINPFTGPKMVKSWKAELTISFSNIFYKELEHETQTKFFSERLIYRPFSSIQELNDWEGRSSRKNYQKFIKAIRGKDAHGNYVDDPFGGVEISGYVLNVSDFILAMRQYLKSRCHFLEHRFCEDNLEITDDTLRYADIEAKRLIFCSGYEIQQSKFFSWIPIAPVKGEILQLRLDENFETIYNKSCFIIPQGKGIYKAGSTYDREDMTEKPTQKGRNKISQKLDALLKMNYEIVAQEAGIRPGTVTRRPLIGFHPVHQELSVFNGLGTKGVSLAPFFSDQFVKCLEEGNNLDEEVDIKKYYSLYFNSHFSEEN